MNNKGFSLVELGAIILIIGFVLTIAFTVVVNVIGDIRTAMYTNNEKTMVRAAKNYVAGNFGLQMPITIGDSVELDLTKLVSSNLINSVLDPKDNTTQCTGKVIITKKSSDDFTYSPYLKCGTNYTTSDVETVQNNLVSSMSSVFNVGPNNYTVTINLNPGTSLINDPYELVTPTSTIGIYSKSIIDYSTWVNGTTGSQTGFSQNGIASENSRLLKANPWGVTDLVWATTMSDATSDADGGWNTSTFAIDPTKKYRYTVWARRENVGTGSGTTYYGTNGYNSSATNIGVIRLSDSTAQTNYYFGAQAYGTWPLIVDNWVLFVNYIHPYTYALTTSDTTSGIYNLAGTKLYNLTDCKWQSTNALSAHRTYLFYSTKVDERHYWYRPRVDLVDGTEPSISELIAGTETASINGYATISVNGTVTYTVPSTGTYTFKLKRSNGNYHTFTYTVS